MKNILLTLACFVLFGGVSLAQQAKPPVKKPAPPRTSTDMAELIFKRMDANHDGSISLKEFKTAFPRMRQSYTRGSSPARGSQGRTRSFDGKTPSFRPPESRSRGNSRGISSSRGRSHRGKSREGNNGKDK